MINEPFARSGIRKNSPISFMTIDSMARCLTISAVQQKKLLYLLDYSERDDTLSISSPLEVVNSNSFTLSMVDCPSNLNNNPIFTSIEIENQNYFLIFYLLDLGLNHIIKKAFFKISDPSVCFLFALPNILQHDQDPINPCVLLGFNKYLLVKDMNGSINIKIDMPSIDTNEDVFIISATMQKLKKNEYFILLQSNRGHLYKLTHKFDADDNNSLHFSMTFFDAILPSSSMHIFKNGFMFTNSEYNDNKNYLFQFQSLGEEGEKQEYKPDILQNLSIASTQQKNNPLLSSSVNNSTPLQLITSNSKENTITVLSNATRFNNLISTNLPPNVRNIWTIKAKHSLMFLSFINSTMILQITNDSMEQLTLPYKSPFIEKDEMTIYVNKMGSNSIVQICTNTLRQIHIDTNQTFTEKLNWFPPAGIHITNAQCNDTQLILSLSNNEIVYFQMDQSDSLMEYQRRLEFNDDEPITSISLIESSSSTTFSNIMAIGTKGSLIKIVSLNSNDPDTFLEVVSLQTTLSAVNQLKLVSNNKTIKLHVGLDNGVYMNSNVNVKDGTIFDVRTKYLGPNPITLSHLPSVSILERHTSNDDEDESEDEDEKEQLAVKQNCIVIHGLNTWISYNHESLSYIRPLSMPHGTKYLKSVAPFVTENVPLNGCVGLGSNGGLIIGKLDDFPLYHDWFHSDEVADAESEEEEDEEEDEDEDEDQILKKASYRNKKILPFTHDNRTSYKLIIDNSLTDSKCKVRLVDMDTGEIGTYFGLTTPNSDSFDFKCKAAAITKFGKLNDNYLVIATESNKLCTFQFFIKRKPRQFTLELLHTTDVEGNVNCMIPFKDLLLVPYDDNFLVLYDLGKKQLLKRSISKTLPSMTRIVQMANWQDERIAVGDIHQSVTLLHFDQRTNSFIPLADDITQRHVTSLAFLDKSTVIGGDRFGNVWTLRLADENEDVLNKLIAELAADQDSNVTLLKSLLRHDSNLRNKLPNIFECPFKLTLMNHFFINDIVMNFHIIESLQMSDRPTILYTGLQGSIGCLVPLLAKSQITMLKKIEKAVSEADDILILNRYMKKTDGNDSDLSDADTADAIDFTNTHHGKKEDTRPEGYYSIVGRDHSKYRGYYAPVRNTVDGDLCESFLNFTSSEQTLLCRSIGKKVHTEDIQRYINEIRTNYI